MHGETLAKSLKVPRTDAQARLRAGVLVSMPLALLRAVPIWTVIAGSICCTIAFLPNIVAVFGIHNDYEMLIFKNRGILFHETEQLFSIARPFAALLCNLTLLPAETIADFRWTRVFSLVTLCFLVVIMIALCIHRFRMDALTSTAVALAALLVPPFIYSVLNAPAWAAHLLPVGLSFAAYALLARTNVTALPFLEMAGAGPYRWRRQVVIYCQQRPVWQASLLFQVALYTSPPVALAILTLTVVGVLFSRVPLRLRAMIGLRDITFTVANLLIYAITVKVLYLPLVRLLVYRYSASWLNSSLSSFDERAATSYNFGLNLDLGIIAHRLIDILRVSGDLWFLPQLRLHIVLGILAGIVLMVLVVRRMQAPPKERASPWLIALLLAEVVGCFILSAAPVLISAGGFITYRTVPVPIMIAAICATFVVAALARATVGAFAGSPKAGTAAASVALVLIASAATAGNFQMNQLTMQLARNETAYFRQIVKQALAERSNAVVIIDPRPFTLPEDHPVEYDQRGRAIPPYELSCFSSVCLQNSAIVTVLAEEIGIPRGKLRFLAVRGGVPIENANCRMFTDPAYVLPRGMPEKAVLDIKFMRSLAPVTCVEYSLDWRDVGREP